jgi:metal-sulfur cluster biosynthetic enzyme
VAGKTPSLDLRQAGVMAKCDITGMAHSTTPFWIHPADAAPATAVSTTAACTGCAPDEGGQACHDVLGGLPCTAPRLAGPTDTLQRALHSLRQVAVGADGSRNIVDLQLVASLRIDEGEAELTVTFPLRCGNAMQVAESAFQALRHLLPDTDVYVRHAV